jgi:type I restriction enzyme R subunit
MLSQLAGGRSLQSVTSALIAALDPDASPEGPNRDARLAEALEPLAANPALRQRIVDIKRSKEQTIDTVSQDEILEAGYSAAARERAGALVRSFEAFVEEHKNDITALQVLYGRPYGQRLRYDDVKALAEAIQAPPRQWTPDRLWHAYEALYQSRVRGAPQRVLSNVVSLVRFALTHDELVPFPDVVEERFGAWLAQQEQGGRRFTVDQLRWLENIRDHIAANLEITPDDLDYAPFLQRGGLGGAHRVFGAALPSLLDELTGVLAA